MTKKDRSKSAPLQDSYLSSSQQRTTEQRRIDYFNDAVGTPGDKLGSLSRFMSRQHCAKMLAQYEMMRLTEGVLGDILECGVYFGSGLMNWALIAATVEPFNYQSKVIGFDTFAGSVGINDVDRRNPFFKRKDGDYAAPVYDDLQEAIAIYDSDRPLNHIGKVALVRGNIVEQAPAYVEAHPELVVRILHTGMNLHEPTLAALKAFLPRMAKGGIVAIDGLNYAAGGCLVALQEALGGTLPKLKVFPTYPNFTYYIVE